MLSKIFTSVTVLQYNIKNITKTKRLKYIERSYFDNG